MGPEILGSFLHHCSKIRAFGHGISLHGALVKKGMEDDVFISNHLLNMYAKCGRVDYARQVFDRMCVRNLVSWSAMISGYDQAGKHLQALELFSKMQFMPNEFVFGSAISGCASLLALRMGKRIHAQSVTSGYSSVSFVSNSLVSMYMKCGQLNDALLVFRSLSEPNCVAYNAIISGLVENQQTERGFEIFRIMCQKGHVPDRFTFMGLFSTCTSPDDFWRGMQLHCQSIKLKLDSTAFVGNVIIGMYSNFSLIEEAEKVFWLIEEKDVISWNTFIAACSHCLDHVKGLSVFAEMLKRFSLGPDDFAYTSAIAACSGLAYLPFGRQIHAHIIRTRMSYDVAVSNALINMYAKCGCIQQAMTVFNQMDSHNLVSWNSIIVGFANHGLGEKALDLFEHMKKLCIKPDSVTFVALLGACNHAGLVDEGKAYFDAMDEMYGVAPEIEHVSCIVDLLGRAGRLKEAEKYMEKFSFAHDPVVLGCLLATCRLHGDVVIGKRIAKHLLNVQHSTTSPYVLLSNLYASERMWDGVAEMRKMLKDSGLTKEPGHSLIQVKGAIEKFTVCSFSHSRIEEIVDVLKTSSLVGEFYDVSLSLMSRYAIF